MAISHQFRFREGMNRWLLRSHPEFGQPVLRGYPMNYCEQQDCEFSSQVSSSVPYKLTWESETSQKEPKGFRNKRRWIEDIGIGLQLSFWLSGIPNIKQTEE